MAGVRRWRVWVLALIAAVAAACQRGAPERDASPVPVHDAEAARFEQIVRDLASPRMEGRDVNTAGLDRARDYIAERFAELGLKPAMRAHVTPAGDATQPGDARRAPQAYLQPFKFDLGMRVQAQSLTLKAGEDDAAVRFDAGTDFNALGFSGEGAFAGEPVVAGYGITSEKHDYDSYGNAARQQIEDRVVIALRYEPTDDAGRSRWADASNGNGDGDTEVAHGEHRRRRWSRAVHLPRKAKRAAQHGAAALLVVTPQSMDDQGPLLDTRRTVMGDEVSIPVMHVRGATFRRILEAAGRDAFDAARVYEQRANEGGAQLDVLEGVKLRGEVQLEHQQADVHNVIARSPGQGALADEVVVLGAHYDHVGMGGGRRSRSDKKALHPGADDNASGVAGLLLTARFHQAYVKAHPDAPRRTVLFAAFTAEERGLHGARYMVTHPGELAVSLDKCIAMINLDMIGRLDEALYVFGTSSASQWPTLIARTETAHDPPMRIASRETVTALGDHAAFYSALDVPVLHLFTGVHADYHKPADTADKIDAAGGAAVARFTAALVQRLATRDDAIDFVDTELNRTLPSDARGE